ncbi:MAG: tetratricopeptide repeat protein [Paludibacter sp.]|nr:tetratricopeptide repeat protein [Paludibacter sp.]
MKKSLLMMLTLCFCISGFSQESGKKKSDTFMKELAENGCKCVDSISTFNKSTEDIGADVSKCIDKQTGAYQLGSKFMDIDLSNKNTTQKSITININSDKNSKEYKGYYYDMERYMMSNCKSLKRIVGANNLENYYSTSKNPEARKLYTKGDKEYEKGKYEKAIEYFKKALLVDSLYAFAWDNIGLCYRKLNNYDEAIYAYNRSLNIDVLGQMPLQNIAVAYTYKKEYDKAISAYERLAELDAKNPEIYYGIGRIYATYLNEYEKGLENMCKAYNLYDKAKSPYRTDAENVIGFIFLDMKKQGKADRFNEILKENNINPTFK